MSEFDYLLHRQLRDGKQYDKLIPKTQCNSTYLGQGMTDFSVNEMAEMVREYSWQMAKVAPLLRKGSLQSLCNAVWDFIYWHFQYKADDEDQMLRSPACSWYSRQTGIDCKSYSILASCILSCLGIEHYIRRIKQPEFMPDLWTHVYVVVPKDQQGGKLAKGYHVIDGTVSDNKEPVFIEKSDLYMSMKHYGLNAPAVIGAGPNAGLAAAQYLANHPAVHGLAPVIAAGNGLNGLRGVSLDFIKNMFGNGWTPSCIGGSLNANNFNTTLQSVVPAFDAMINTVNISVASSNPSVINDINKLLKEAAQLRSHANVIASGNWSSSCSKDSVKAYKQLADYYYNIVYQAFMAWLTNYFTISTTTTNGPNNTFSFAIGYDKNSDVETTSWTTITKLTVKPSTTAVKRFEITPYVATPANQGSGFNVGGLLNSLSGLLVTFVGGSGSVTTTTTNPQTGTTTSTTYSGSGNPQQNGGVLDNSGNGGGYIDTTTGLPKAEPNTLGGGWLAGIIVLAGLGYVLANKGGKPERRVGTRQNKPSSTKKTK